MSSLTATFPSSMKTVQQLAEVNLTDPGAGTRHGPQRVQGVVRVLRLDPLPEHPLIDDVAKFGGRHGRNLVREPFVSKESDLHGPAGCEPRCRQPHVRSEYESLA